jgi:methylated-DNA-[protein]-cysteine S-methyltransferase
MAARYWSIYESPLGPLTTVAGPAGVRSLHFPGRAGRLDEAAQRPMPRVAAQLQEYFAGERQRFDLDLDLAGTRFQRLVWARLLEIPYGSTTTYGELARSIGEDAYPPGLRRFERVRFAAAAVGRTPTPILIPCHRVIGADGSLTGYLGGLQRKRALLDLEGRTAAGLSPLPAPAQQLQLL